MPVLGPDGTGDLTGVKAIATLESQCIVLKEDDTVWAWGWNYYGQLGDGTAYDKNTPTQVAGFNMNVAKGPDGPGVPRDRDDPEPPWNSNTVLIVAVIMIIGVAAFASWFLFLRKRA
jgi:alpha-tubulin suppressor-like RCC1 family protein